MRTVHVVVLGVADVHLKSPVATPSLDLNRAQAFNGVLALALEHSGTVAHGSCMRNGMGAWAVLTLKLGLRTGYMYWPVREPIFWGRTAHTRDGQLAPRPAIFVRPKSTVQ